LKKKKQVKRLVSWRSLGFFFSFKNNNNNNFFLFEFSIKISFQVFLPYADSHPNFLPSFFTILGFPSKFPSKFFYLTPIPIQTSFQVFSPFGFSHQRFLQSFFTLFVSPSKFPSMVFLPFGDFPLEFPSTVFSLSHHSRKWKKPRWKKK
jgi:hypothetical protein